MFRIFYFKKNQLFLFNLLSPALKKSSQLRILDIYDITWQSSFNFHTVNKKTLECALHQNWLVGHKDMIV